MTDPNLPNLHGDDPRQAGGDIAGPGGPYDKDAVVLDTTNAVILDYSTVVLVEAARQGQTPEPCVALMLEGRINKTTQRTKILYMMNGDGAAAIITELAGIAARAKNQGATQLADELLSAFGERWKDMPK